ncbi:MAG: protein phosphatase 2C domain-containing protein [Candidatus Accumulibacter sp.]|nr:protein phosphatase 2C domain-containing protein [Candidatus Accumulibacter propinquus]
MLWGLFTSNERPFFSRSSLSPKRIEDFVESPEAHAAASHFAVSLMNLWTRQNPGTRLEVMAMDPAKSGPAKPIEFEEFTSYLGGDLAGVSDSHPTPESTPPVDDPARPTTSEPVTDPKQAARSIPLQTELPLDIGLRPAQVPLAGSVARRPPDPKVTLRFPNAKVGQDYLGRIEGTGISGAPVHIRNVRFPADLGLSFDVATEELRGVPVVPGDHRISLQWAENGVDWYAGEGLLFVNHNPRSLWKQIDPPAGDPYFKDNIDGDFIVGSNLCIAVASRRGRSHEHAGTFRDDDFFVKHDENSGWTVLIVADGAGSARNSRWGSKLAVEAAGAHIAANLAGEFGARVTQALGDWSTDMTAASKAMSAPFYLLFQEASKLAVQAIESEAQSKAAQPKEYSTTLLAAAVRRDGNETFLATFWMGDGAIAAYGPRGKFRLMGTPDSGEFAGQTRFLDRAALTDPGFGKRLGLGRYSDLTGVMLMTDGVSDPRFETDNGLADAAKWDALWDEISPLLALPDPDRALIEWLDFFTPGHHDDRTIAVLWRPSGAVDGEDR